MSEKKINITKISKERFNNISFIFRENFSVSLEKFNDKKTINFATLITNRKCFCFDKDAFINFLKKDYLYDEEKNGPVKEYLKKHFSKKAYNIYELLCNAGIIEILE